ncbi:MAG: hypothetical protein NTX79_08555 [Candidatus Micrarchaeota archaeon]|nr:hypothetical protein [Candidatus Micrarchaeota archaeon]
MAAQLAAFALTYLLSVAFTDEISFNLSSIERLVTYHQDMGFTEIIPGALYNGSITANWAVPPSALSGIGTDSLIVKVTATAPENSSVYFPLGASQAKETSVYLECKIVGGVCANGSVLSVDIPVAASAKPDAASEAKISLRSEIVPSIPASYSATLQDAGSAFDSLKRLFLQNSTDSAQANASAAGGNSTAGRIEIGGLNFSLGAQGASAQNGSGNFLDSLKPEGDSSDPLLFLRQNPLISISALVVVIVITGAYLLNSKD